MMYLTVYSGFSGTIPIDSILFSGYNFYLGLPVLALGALDFDIPRADVLRFPKTAYATGRLGELLNLKNMTRWCLFGFAQGLLLFIVVVRFVGGVTYVGTNSSGALKLDIAGQGLLSSMENGWEVGMFPSGYMLYSCAVIAMQYKIVAMTTNRTSVFWFVWVLSFVGYFLFSYVYGLFVSTDWYNVLPLAFRQSGFWLGIFLVPILLAISDIAFEVLWRRWYPSSMDQLQVLLANSHSNEKVSGEESLNTTSPLGSQINTVDGGRDNNDIAKKSNSNTVSTTFFAARHQEPRPPRSRIIATISSMFDSK